MSPSSLRNAAKHVLTQALNCSFTDKYERGLYAARVIGRLPEDVVEELTSRGFTYQRREYVFLSLDDVSS